MKRTKHATVDPQSGSSKLAEVFSSQVRAEVLTWMFGRKEKAHSLTELSRALGLAVSSVQHEMYKLERLGILVGRREGASRRYRLTVDDPMTQALEHLVRTAVDAETLIRLALANTDGLEWGTVAANASDELSGIVLVLVGEIDLGGLVAIQERIASILDVEPGDVSTSFYSPEVWQQHQADGNTIVQRLKTMRALATYGETT
jgi:DNA-binding transcriptional ArsR family regulator